MSEKLNTDNVSYAFVVLVDENLQVQLANSFEGKEGATFNLGKILGLENPQLPSPPVLRAICNEIQMNLQAKMTAIETANMNLQMMKEVEKNRPRVLSAASMPKLSR